MVVGELFEEPTNREIKAKGYANDIVLIYGKVGWRRGGWIRRCPMKQSPTGGGLPATGAKV